MDISKPTRPQGYAAHREARARNPPLPTPRLIGWRYHRLQRPWSYSYRSQSPSTCSLPWASRLVETRTLMWARSLAHLHLSISGATAALSLRVREAHGVSACLRRQRSARRRSPECSYTKDRRTESVILPCDPSGDRAVGGTAAKG